LAKSDKSSKEQGRKFSRREGEKPTCYDFCTKKKGDPTSNTIAGGERTSHDWIREILKIKGETDGVTGYDDPADVALNYVRGEPAEHRNNSTVTGAAVKGMSPAKKEVVFSVSFLLRKGDGLHANTPPDALSCAPPVDKRLAAG